MEDAADQKFWVLTKTGGELKWAEKGASDENGPVARYLVVRETFRGGWHWKVYDERGEMEVASGNLEAADHGEATRKAKAEAREFLEEKR